MVGEHVIPDASDHANQRAARQTPGRARLVRALASWNHLETASKNRFPGNGQVVRADHEVHIQTAQDNDGGLQRDRSMPSFFSSSA